MAKPTVYVETSVFSVIVARSTKDLVATARQHITRVWWQNDADHFSLFASDIVQLESRLGDAEMAKLRLEYIATIPRLSNTGESEWIADSLVTAGILPPKARADALHIAIATSHSLEFVVSWNLRHLANALNYRRVSRHLTEIGYNPPMICTPDQLPGVPHARR